MKVLHHRYFKQRFDILNETILEYGITKVLRMGKLTILGKDWGSHTSVDFGLNSRGVQKLERFFMQF
jgi:hypothetical protein